MRVKPHSLMNAHIARRSILQDPRRGRNVDRDVGISHVVCLFIGDNISFWEFFSFSLRLGGWFRFSRSCLKKFVGDEFVPTLFGKPNNDVDWH